VVTANYLAPSEPDILEVIANLSNDQVFTPPRVVNAVLDMLPAEIWTEPSLKWLDPGCKTGVFPREITKRLIAGLADAIPDDQARLEHILGKMVFAVATETVTSLMARRTLYCSKSANGEFSAVTMPTAAGNVWFERVEHSYEKGRCTECGASSDQMEREGRDNHAYAFIHASGRQAIEEEMGMKFDVIVGNPPYQMDSDGSNRTMPLYNLFVEQAKAINPRYIAMIIPSRWMGSGLGLSGFRSEMLSDSRIRHLVDFPDSSELFPAVKVMGGACYFLWDRDSPGTCESTLVRSGKAHGPVERRLDEYDIFVRDSRALDILRKVLARKEASLYEILSSDKEFGLTSNFSDYSTKQFPSGIPLYAYQEGSRLVGWIKRDKIQKSAHLIDTWKVLIPAAGFESQILPTLVLSSLRRAPNPSACTQTYLFIPTSSEESADSAETYIRTRFARFLVWLRKVSQHATRSTYRWVPQQTWDREWTDAELYEKYGITEEEQAYIAEMVRDIPA
jgi:site-specific DNA-methyltransferase (adenine-specific)